MRQEALSDEDIDEFFRHGLVVFAGVTDVSKDLGERLLVVDALELQVLRQVLLVVIVLVDVFGQIVLVGLLVHKTFHGQTAGEGRFFCWPANGECRYRHHKLWKP